MGDVAARYSAEQYIVMLPYCDYESSQKVIKRIVSASKEGVVHNRSFFVILTTDSFEALFISYFKPAGIW